MAFSSSLFLFVFVPVFFFSYFLTPGRGRKYVLLIGSYLFYAWGAPAFSATLLVSLFFDWLLGNKIYHYRDNVKVKKHYFLIYLALNVSALAYFKYSNFFIDNLNNVLTSLHLGSTIQWPQMIAPLAISFIFFHKISYAADIYSLKATPAKLGDYSLYILLFPKILAGPIIRYQDMAEQLLSYKTCRNDIVAGTLRFSTGLAKKVIIADTLGIVADQAFQISALSLDFSSAWLGIICYTFQLYFDFSGYTDMAIGLAKIMGFNFPENFNRPYIAQSFTEFWKRWHITLSTWLKEYVYYPLGGNRCSLQRNYANIMAVFLISGLWHGANWTFIIWGIYHAVFVVLDKAAWLKIARKTPKALNIALTFFLILIGWVIFRSSSINAAMDYLSCMFSAYNFSAVSGQSLIILTNFEKLIILLAAAFSFLPACTSPFTNKPELSNCLETVKNNSLVMMLLSIVLFALAITKMISSAHTPFIYFSF